MDFALSLMVLAALVLTGGAVFLWRRDGATRQVWLMIVLAMVMLANVAIWTIPDGNGEAPLRRTPDE